VRPEEFHRAIAKGAPAAAYFFTGPETHLRESALSALVALVPEGLRDFNVSVHHAFEADIGEVIGAARTAPLMAPRRIVVLREVEKMRLGEGAADLLHAYLKDPSPESVFVVTTESEERAKELRKRMKEARWVEVAFGPFRGGDLERRVREEAVRLGLRLDPAAAPALVAAAGEDLGRILGELEKLRTALGEGASVGEEEVMLHVAGYAHRGTRDLLAAIGGRDLEGALRVLAGITMKPDEWLPFMGMLGRQLRLLWFYVDGGAGAPASMRVWPSLAATLRRDAAHFSRGEVDRGLALLAETDALMKGGSSLPGRLLFERFLLRFLSP